MRYLLPIAAIVTLLAGCRKSNLDYDATGIFEATEVIVSAKTQGEIVVLNCEEGDELNALTIVGYIDTTMLALQKQALLANLSATEARRLDVNAQVASLKQQSTNLQQEKTRFERLIQKGAASQKQLDDINYQIVVVEKQIKALGEQVNSANRSAGGQSAALEAQILMIQKQLSDCAIQAPITGAVIGKYAEQGEFTAPGKPILKIADIKHIRLRAYITATQLTQIKIGETVKVYADYGKNESIEYKGLVTWISDKAEFTPKTIQTRDERANLVYAIKVSVENDGQIKRGMYGNIRFGQ